MKTASDPVMPFMVAWGTATSHPRINFASVNFHDQWITRKPTSTTSLQSSLGLSAALLTSVWCGAKLNANKSELMWIGPTLQLHQLPSPTSTIHVNQCQCIVKPVTIVRYLGAWFNAELSMVHIVLIICTKYVQSVDNLAAMSQQD